MPSGRIRKVMVIRQHQPLQAPSAVRPTSLEECQKWRGAVFCLGRYAKTALAEVSSICKAEIMLTSEQGGSSAKCVQTIQQGTRRLEGLINDMKVQAQVLPEDTVAYAKRTSELGELLSEGHQVTGLWHRVKDALEDIQRRGANDLQHLGDCQRALSKREFLCGKGTSQKKEAVPSQHMKPRTSQRRATPEVASHLDPSSSTEDKSRHHVFILETALVQLLRALNHLDATALKREKVRSEAYILKFENEYAENASSRDEAVRMLRGLLDAGPGGGPAFEPGSERGQFLEVVLLAMKGGEEGEGGEEMSREVMQALTKDIEDFLKASAEVAVEATRIREGMEGHRRRRRNSESLLVTSRSRSLGRTSTPLLPAAAAKAPAPSSSSSSAAHRLARVNAPPAWDANDLLLVNGEAQAFRVKALSNTGMGVRSQAPPPPPQHSHAAGKGLEARGDFGILAAAAPAHRASR